MAKKTVSEVAKELGIERKDLVGYLEKQSKAKVSAKTTLADDEVERAKEVLGLGPKPQVKIGEERTVTQDVVNETGGTTRETVTERRTTGTLIRRRKVKEAVATEAPGELPPEGDGLQPPPAEMIGEMSEDRARLHDGHLRAVHRPADAIDLDEWSLHPNSVKTLGSGRNSGVTPGSTACE